MSAHFGTVKFQRTRISSIIKYINRVRLRHGHLPKPGVVKEENEEGRRRKHRVSRQTSIGTSTTRKTRRGETTFAGSGTIIAGHEGGGRPPRRVESKTKSRKWKTKYRRRVVRSRRYPSLLHLVTPACPFPPGVTSPHRDAGGPSPLAEENARTRASGIERWCRGRGRESVGGGGGDTNGTPPAVPHQGCSGASPSGAEAFSKVVGERATEGYRP